MHPFSLAPEAIARVTARCGKPHPFDKFDPKRTALVVVDMQNGFMQAGVAHALCPMAERIAELEHRAITEALAHTDGNRTAAARLLGISRASLYDRLEKMGAGSDIV